MKSSTRIDVSGASPHSGIADIPVDSKILLFIYSIQLIEIYIINSIGSLAMNSLYVYIHSVINEVWDLL
jgi:hypothetical protein